MTDNETIKALESLLDRMRAYEAQQASIGKGLVEDIISMYDRQKAEIEELTTLCDMQDKNMLEQKAEIERLQKFKTYFDSLYGINLEVEGWHENGNTISFDEFYDSAIEDMDSAEHHISYIIKCVKSEAIKEFAEKVETDLDKRVSKSIRNRNPHWYIAKRIVRETAIEMTEQSVNYESSKRMEGENENH